MSLLIGLGFMLMLSWRALGFKFRVYCLLFGGVERSVKMVEKKIQWSV